MDWILNLVGSGVFGSLGTFGGAIFAYFSKKEANKQALEMRKFDLKEIEAERESAVILEDKQTAQIIEQGKIETELANTAAFTTSLKSFQLSGIAWVDAIRSLMRPVITVFLLILTAFFVWQNPAAVEQDVLSLTSLAVGWWFGSRIVR